MLSDSENDTQSHKAATEIAVRVMTRDFRKNTNTQSHTQKDIHIHAHAHTHTRKCATKTNDGARAAVLRDASCDWHDLFFYLFRM